MILLYGSGGHAKVVLECLASEGKSVRGFFDDNPALVEFNKVPVFGKYNTSQYIEDEIIVTIGNNQVRQKISRLVVHSFGQAIDKRAIVSSQSKIGKGSMVLQGAIIQVDSYIGNHVIINTRAIVEHDCKVADFAHIGPGAVLCGHVEIGEGTLIGANAVVAPLVKVGKWCQISAGSSVLEDIPDHSMVMGVPGRVVKTLIP